MKTDTDIDIDLADRTQVLSLLSHVVARINRESDHEKHNSGIYFQPIPHNPLEDMATIDYKQAQELGYFKIDLLNNSVYQGVKNESHLIELMNCEPLWELLEHAEIVSQLYHINQYASLTAALKPTSVEELAMLLAVIRPGKSHLRNKPWKEIKKTVWDKPTDGSYYFKKAHAIAFATAIVVQLNSLCEESGD